MIRFILAFFGYIKIPKAVINGYAYQAVRRAMENTQKAMAKGDEYMKSFVL